MSLHGKLPLAGREKISSRVRWCFRFIQHSTAYWYQVRLPFRCMQDTDNAPDQKRGEPLAITETSAPVFCIWMLATMIRQ